MFLLPASVSLIVLALILCFTLREAIPVFAEPAIQGIPGPKWRPTYEAAPRYGILPMIGGTLLVAVGSMAIAIPLGLAAATVIAEMAAGWMKDIAKTALELLAAIPSIVYGFSGLMILSPYIRDSLGVLTGQTDLTASLRLAGMVGHQGISAVMGPSGCGKSTFLRTLNRMYELTPGAHAQGRVSFLGQDLLKADPAAIRHHIGMVFQRPNPFPKSIYENVAYGLRIQGVRKRSALSDSVEESLRHAGLWTEVKDRLKQSAFGLSGGQQQRLCVARAIAVRPKVLLMDEPCSSLDPKASARIEDLARELSDELTVIIVTHNLQQAARVSDNVAVFMAGGELAEFGTTRQVFDDPQDPRVADYLRGRFG